MSLQQALAARRAAMVANDKVAYMKAMQMEKEAWEISRSSAGAPESRQWSSGAAGADGAVYDEPSAVRNK